MAVNRASHRLDVRLLGAVTAHVDGNDCAITSGRQRSILALLATAAGEVVSVDRIVDAVWGEAPPPSATNALQVHMSALRKALGPASAALATRPPGYVLDGSKPDLTVEIDALVFERLARAKLATDDGPPWEAIAALWKGPPLDDLDAEFARLFAERLTELHRSVVEAMCDDQLSRGLHEQLLPDMQSYVEAEPYRERRWRQWVLALYRSGRQSEALATYQRARQQLIDDLGIEPGPALAALERAVLAQDPALDLVAESFTATPVPRPATSTVGRDDEIDRIVGLLVLDSDARIVTLAGPGGVGKTRLAQEAARRLATDYKGRVAFSDLSDIVDPDVVMSEVARCAGVSPVGDAAQAIMAAARNPLLIIVDNAEQVVAGLHEIGKVAQHSECRFLVTSRVPVRLSGEHVVSVAPLSTAAAAALFRARVEAVSPGALVDDVTARNVASAVDGLALAIELAAALSRVMSADDIARELSTTASGLDALGGGQSDAPRRHRSLSAALEWSVELLSERARALLLCLGSFATAFRLQDVRWLAPEPLRDDAAAVRDVVAELVDSSLLVRQTSELTMLTTVRAYVRSLVPTGDQRMLADRHGEWVQHVVDDIRTKLEAGVDEASAMAEFAQRLPDLRAAIHHFRTSGRLDDAVGVILGTRSCWVQQGSLEEALRSLNDIHRESRSTPTRPEFTRLLDLRAMAFRGLLAKAVGDSATGIPLLESAATGLRVAAPGSLDLLNSLCHLAAHRAEVGDHEAAAGLAREAVEVAPATGAASVSMAWDLTGYVAGLAGHTALAVDAARHAVATERQRPSTQLPHALSGLAEALAAAGEIDEAIAISRQAIEQAKVFSVAPTLVAEVHRRVSAAFAHVDPATSAAQLASAAASYAAVGMGASLAETLLTLGGIAATTDPVAAARLLGASVGPSYLDGPKRTEIESQVKAQIGTARYNAEHVAGTLLDGDAAARLAADLAARMSQKCAE